MTAVRLAIAFLILVILLGIGVWYYLFGPNRIAAADLVPADTIAFATIPNAARIVADYETSQLKKLVNAPDAKPLVDSISNLIGPKNLDLLQAFLPEMSGQSFVAVTHYDPANPAKVGLIAGLKPKPGAGNFTSFVEKWKASYPSMVAQATTGDGQVEGLDYQWIKGPSASDKICVAHYNGWIITTWGEDTLRDWWERWQKKSATPSLSQNGDYQKSLKRVGVDSEAILYLDYHALLGLLQSQMARTNSSSANFLAAQSAGMGAITVGSRFEHGEIADRFSLLMPRQAQLDAGYSGSPCAFDTLKFTGPDTRFYWGATMNFPRLWSNLQKQVAAAPATNPAAGNWVASLQDWAKSRNLDFQKNIIGPLGNEVSVQSEWSADSTYPEAGIYVKLEKPDDFKPTIAAIIDTIRERYATSAVINEIHSGDQNFATLKFIQALPISPTITEDGPYFGVFATENQAVRSFKRDASTGLAANDEFKAQIGDRQKRASQIVFLDSPRLLDRGYQTVLPYVSLAAMFNRSLGALVHGRTLPPDLQWLAPMGTWTFSSSHDDDGITAYSVSGIGNQGIFVGGGFGGGVTALRLLGRPGMPLPFGAPGLAAPFPGSSAPISSLPGTPIMPTTPVGGTPDVNASPEPPPNSVPLPTPPSTPVAPAGMNGAPAGVSVAPAPADSAQTNAAPSPAPMSPDASPSAVPAPVTPASTTSVPATSPPPPEIPNGTPPASGPSTNL